MNLKSFSFIAAIVFSLVSLLHLVRIIYDSKIHIENWEAPMSISIIGSFVTTFLAYKGFQLSRKKED